MDRRTDICLLDFQVSKRDRPEIGKTGQRVAAENVEGPRNLRRGARQSEDIGPVACGSIRHA